MNVPHDQPWLERALALLDHSADSLDAATLSRLNRARQAALAQAASHARPRWLFGVGLAGAALALLLAFVIVPPHVVAPMPAPIASDAADDADVVAAQDNLDLYENLDFYAWLDTQGEDDNG